MSFSRTSQRRLKVALALAALMMARSSMLCSLASVTCRLTTRPSQFFEVLTIFCSWSRMMPTGAR